MISVKNISKKYGSLEVLKDVSLEIKKGEIVSIVGSSGAGKSTLLQIMGTLTKADTGILEINSKKINILGLDAISQTFLPQVGPKTK